MNKTYFMPISCSGPSQFPSYNKLDLNDNQSISLTKKKYLDIIIKDDSLVSHFVYGLLSWGGIGKTILNKVIIAQKRTLNIIF